MNEDRNAPPALAPHPKAAFPGYQEETPQPILPYLSLNDFTDLVLIFFVFLVLKGFPGVSHTRYNYYWPQYLLNFSTFRKPHHLKTLEHFVFLTGNKTGCKMSSWNIRI